MGKDEDFNVNLLEEFDSAHEVVKEVIDEYHAATKANYINYKPSINY